MKLSHAIILIALLTGQYASLANASTSANVICQFDRYTMIKQKLKKAHYLRHNKELQEEKIYKQDLEVSYDFIKKKEN